eukprot:IDg16337t1
MPIPVPEEILKQPPEANIASETSAQTASEIRLCNKWADCPCKIDSDSICKCGPSCSCGKVTTETMTKLMKTTCGLVDCGCGADCKCGSACKCGTKLKTKEDWIKQALGGGFNMCKKWADCGCDVGSDGICKCGDSCKCGSISTSAVLALMASTCGFSDCGSRENCGCGSACKCGTIKKTKQEWIALACAKSKTS